MRDEDTYLDDAYDMGINEAKAAELVQYYAKRPVTVSTGAATGTVVAAFTLGALTAVGAMTVLRYLGDRR